MFTSYLSSSIRLFCFFIFALSSISLFGLDVKYCRVNDPAKHERNKEIIRGVVVEELRALPGGDPKQRAARLMARIQEIALKVLQRGFYTDAYGVPELDEGCVVSFAQFCMWEGKECELPVSFFIYAWPSQRVALRYNSRSPLNYYYATNVHSHPIPCAFAVLKGSVFQISFAQTHPSSWIVSPIETRTFCRGEGEVDDLADPFIHQLYSKDTDVEISLSLHAYGLSSAALVMDCFRKEGRRCSYQLATQ